MSLDSLFPYLHVYVTDSLMSSMTFFLQELNDSFPDFSAVSVSGMDSASLLSGHLYGRISFWSSMSSCITPLMTGLVLILLV